MSRRPQARKGTAGRNSRQRVPRWRSVVRWVGVAILALVLVGLGLAWPVIVRGPLVIGQDAVSNRASEQVVPVIEDAGGRVILARPPEGVEDSGLLVVLYPGGLVRPQAYEWLARRLAAEGFLTVIPEFSFDLAVTDPGRANAVISSYGQGRRVVLAGHSLGGAMAARYLAGQQEFGRQSASALVLMGAYPSSADDLSETSVEVLSLLAEHDQVIDSEALEAGWALLPRTSRRVVIDGAAHSFFGRYGSQAGDGVATVSRAEAEDQIVAAFVHFLEGLRR